LPFAYVYPLTCCGSPASVTASSESTPGSPFWVVARYDISRMCATTLNQYAQDDQR
jgi:hypothetical protein